MATPNQLHLLSASSMAIGRAGKNFAPFEAFQRLFEKRLRFSDKFVITIQEVPLGKTTNYYLHPKDAEGPSENRYLICITFANLTSLSGTVRCESKLNEALGAEIFIENGAHTILLAFKVVQCKYTA